MGLKDEITSALDQHEESESTLEQNSSSPENLLARLDEPPAEFSGSLAEETELIKKLSNEGDANGEDVPSVSLEEALQLAGLDVSKFLMNFSNIYKHNR